MRQGADQGCPQANGIRQSFQWPTTQRCVGKRRPSAETRGDGIQLCLHYSWAVRLKGHLQRGRAISSNCDNDLLNPQPEVDFCSLTKSD